MPTADQVSAESEATLADKVKTTFICPKCGGRWFGFSGEAPDGSLNRHCSNHACRFEWNSKNDDKYFCVLLAVNSFDTLKRRVEELTELLRTIQRCQNMNCANCKSSIDAALKGESQ